MNLATKWLIYREANPQDIFIDIIKQIAEKNPFL